jgi:hypothetical protein
MQGKTMRHFIAATLVVGAMIHLLPLAGVLGAGRLQALYGIAVEEPNLEILLRHRAVLFGVLGVFLLTAAFKPTLQSSAFAAALCSVGAFLAIAALVGSYNALLARVFWVDVVALIVLSAGAAAHWYTRAR